MGCSSCNRNKDNNQSPRPVPMGRSNNQTGDRTTPYSIPRSGQKQPASPRFQPPVVLPPSR